MRIKINPYDIDSVNKAIQQVKDYQKSFDKKIDEILNELVNLGARRVETQFALVTEYEPYDISCEVVGNNAMIIAEGENVIFLEFGTGVEVVDTTDEMETEGLPPIYKGSWSETEGTGMFARNGYWYYNGHKYQGTMATQGFYLASKDIKEQAVKIARRVFKR